MFWKMFIQCIKEARQTKRDVKQIKNLDVCYDSLQRLVNTVAFGANEVEIELTMANGSSLIIRRKPLSETGFETFAEKAKRAQANRVR